jgi:hypothetical protein
MPIKAKGVRPPGGALQKGHRGPLFWVPSVPRDELLRSAEEERAFRTTRQHKSDRERCVVQEYLRAHGKLNADIVPGDDPPDVLVNGQAFEVVEAMPRGRRSGDEQKIVVAAAKKGLATIRPLPGLRQVRDVGHLWIFNEVERKKAKGYDPRASAGWTLLVYANFPWGAHVQWEVLEAKLAELAPPFAVVDVLYNTGAGAVVRRLFVRASEHTKPVTYNHVP